MFCDHILSFYASLRPNWKLPDGVDLIYPFDAKVVQEMMRQYYEKFYSDNEPRHFLFGINPGRLGAGMTGVPFTDPVHLEKHCGINNDIKKKHELSSIYIYEMMEAVGGIDYFHSKFYISSLCPLGFTREGRNYNYYDSKELYAAVRPKMVKAIKQQISHYCHTDVAFSLGQGKNFKVFQELNEQHNWFDKIVPLPHPRWVMQYKRKTKEVYLDEYVRKLGFKS